MPSYMHVGALSAGESFWRKTLEDLPVGWLGPFGSISIKNGGPVDGMKRERFIYIFQLYNMKLFLLKKKFHQTMTST